MRRVRGQLKLLLVAFTGVLLIGGLVPITVLAADNRQGQTITVGPIEVINDDLYVAANVVDIQGTINGNLIAAGSNISIPGEIQGSARLAGAQVTIGGKVAGDLVVAASTVTLAPEASVGRDVMATVGTATFAGSVTRNVQVAGSDVVFSGPVGGNVTAWDSNLKLETGAAIQGNLEYTSSHVVNIANGAVVAGSTHRIVPSSNGPTFASYLIGWLQTLVGFFLLGAILIFLAPRFNARAVEAYRMAPWSRLGLGLSVLVVIPIVAVMAFVLGLIVGGWWLALFLIGAYALVLAAGYTLVGEMIGHFILERLGRPNVHPLLALLVGLTILMIVASVPFIGWFIGFVALIYGAGIVVMALPWGKPPTRQAAAVVMPPAGLARPTPSAG